MSSNAPQDGSSSALPLLTSRVSDPMQPPGGFEEVYWCTECNDYFVLASLAEGQLMPPRCQKVAAHKSKPGLVFCPGCSEAFDDYGAILPYGA
ncbi:MAG: hypothetical protein ACI9EF_002603 [Pseudohongiellaceae bacterium]|jgi:hypothetical protein